MTFLKLDLFSSSGEWGRRHLSWAPYLRTTHFQVDDTFFQQKDGMAMGSSIPPIVSNMFMEHFEKLALDSAQHKSSLWHVCGLATWSIAVTGFPQPPQ
jgi:hypothetical protein